MAEALSGAFGLRGPVLSVDTACAASANAIGYAAELIRSGQADAVLTGGADAFSDILYAGFNALESLSPEPAAPYSRDRKGLSLGEGSGMLVLMREDLAHEQGAPCSPRSWATACRPTAITRPRRIPKAAAPRARSRRRWLRVACRPSEVRLRQQPRHRARPRTIPRRRPRRRSASGSRLLVVPP